MDLLYRWANDPAVRSNSFQTEPIPYEVHRKWFAGIMAREDVIQFILMEDETPVGQIRLNVEGNDAEIGYSIAPEYRGRGYGRRLLQLAEEKVRSEYPAIHRLTGKVKPGNAASSGAFEKEGFDTAYICYTKEMSHPGRDEE